MLSPSKLTRVVVRNQGGWYTIGCFNQYDKKIGGLAAFSVPEAVEYLKERRNGNAVDVVMEGFPAASHPFSLDSVLKRNGFEISYK